jgi:hypothetical protein
MKIMKFREFFMQEEVTLPIAHGTIDITDQATALNINTLLARALDQEFLTPYIALEKVRQVLARFAVHLEGTTKLFDGDDGSFTFAVMQFGEIADVNGGVNVDKVRFIYFTWELNEEGTFDVFASLVTTDELNELIDDEDEEDAEDMEDDESVLEIDPVPEVASESATETLSPEDKKLDKEHDAGKLLDIVKETDNPAKMQARAAIKKWAAQPKTLDKK